MTLNSAARSIEPMSRSVTKKKFFTTLFSMIAGIAVFMGPLAGVAADVATFGAFGSGDLEGWQTKVFKGETRYTVMKDGDGFAVEAISQGTASGLVHEMTVDLTETPCLIWSWKVDTVLEGLDETTKAGDDFPARVYVVVSGGLFFWNTRALNYVWSGSHPVEATWPNPYTSQSTMVAAQSGQSRAGQWVMESRHVADDFKRFAGVDIEEIDAVAIMTDTDGSGLSATAYYRDIRFSATCDL